ncbi:MAG: Jag N-terminal domain-containing protein [Candidatus Omnitrophica bacterium]|nr:Jag N-terminal domain-containing protein [Candidatus Omnitrophota bacterium]
MENIKDKSVELEVEGRTVEEAVGKATSLLKVSKNQLKVKVLSEEQKGLFGMPGAKPAKIRVSIKSLPASKKKS